MDVGGAQGLRGNPGADAWQEGVENGDVGGNDAPTGVSGVLRLARHVGGQRRLPCPRLKTRFCLVYSEKK